MKWPRCVAFTSRLSSIAVAAGVLVAASPVPANAATLHLGFISYDVFIPGDVGSPGVNAITIANFTGDPAAGGFALEPDFPSHTAVTFLNSSMSLTVDGVLQVVDLGNIGPGVFDSSVDLLFPETALLSALTFSATLSTTSLALADGTPFFADSVVLTLTLLPLFDPAFIAGLDFGLLSVEGSTTVVPVPEAGALALLAVGLPGLLARGRAAAKNRVTSAGRSRAADQT